MTPEQILTHPWPIYPGEPCVVLAHGDTLNIQAPGNPSFPITRSTTLPKRLIPALYQAWLRNQPRLHPVQILDESGGIRETLPARQADR